MSNSVMTYNGQDRLGIAESAVLTVDQPDVLLYGYFPFISQKGTAAILLAPLPAWTLVGFDASGHLVKSVASAKDGSQNPVGITLAPLPANSKTQPVSYYRAGGFNFARLNVDTSWTEEALNLLFTKNYAPLYVGTPGSATDPDAGAGVASPADLA